MKREVEVMQVHVLGVGIIPPDRWAKDHKSTLLYAESRAVDYRGRLDETDPKMRMDGKRYPTRLTDGLEVLGHNDYDCLKDAEAAGFLTYSGGVVRFTDPGWEYVHRLRRERAEAGAFPIPGSQQQPSLSP